MAIANVQISWVQYFKIKRIHDHEFLFIPRFVNKNKNCMGSFSRFLLLQLKKSVS